MRARGSSARPGSRRTEVAGAAERGRTLAGIRKLCLVLTDHHGDGRFAIWCAAAGGMQQMLVDADGERFFVPPYVGHRGWLGFRLDRGLDWDELAGIVEDAYAEVAPAKLVDAAFAAKPTS